MCVFLYGIVPSALLSDDSAELSLIILSNYITGKLHVELNTIISLWFV